MNLPFAQERALLAQIEKESSSTSCRPELPVTACTILANDFSHRRFSQPPTARQFRIPGTKVGMEEDLGMGSQPPPASVLPSSEKNESKLPRIWELPFSALKLLFQNNLWKSYSSINLCSSQTGLMVAPLYHCILCRVGAQ